MKTIFLFLCTLSSVIIGAQKVDLPETFTAKVIGISDGDTIKVLYNKEEIKVRLNHIDAPELGQTFGRKAKQFLSESCFGKQITIIRQKKRDKYKRIIAEIFVEKENINHKMIQNGFAWHFKKYSSDKVYARLEGVARSEKRGLWQEKTPVSPWDFRKERKENNKKKKQLKIELLLFKKV